MPALPPVADVIKSRLFWTIEGDPMAVTILFWHYTSPAPSDADLASFVSNLADAAGTNLAALYQSGITLASADGRDLSAIDAAYATDSIDTPGTRTGGKLAPGTAAVANYSIRQSYRGGKPRSYWPLGTSTDVASTGFWADAFVTDYTTAVQALVTGTIGTTGDLVVDKQCVVSYYGPPNKVITNPTTGRARTVSTRRDATGGTGHPLVYDITAQNGSKVIGSQRRRNRNA
jgi:hypothetical protein